MEGSYNYLHRQDRQTKVRPITMSSCMLKECMLLERIINERLTWWVKRKKVLDEDQNVLEEADLVKRTYGTKDRSRKRNTH